MPGADKPVGRRGGGMCDPDSRHQQLVTQSRRRLSDGGGCDRTASPPSMSPKERVKIVRHEVHRCKKWKPPSPVQAGGAPTLRRKASGCRVRQEKETAMRHSVFLVWCVALTLIGWTSAPAWAADTRLGGHARPPACRSSRHGGRGRHRHADDDGEGGHPIPMRWLPMQSSLMTAKRARSPMCG